MVGRKPRTKAARCATPAQPPTTPPSRTITRDTDTAPAPFARRILREAERRGFDTAERRVILGDGAPWIWNFADEHFPGAVQIVDLFHAKGHLFEVAKAIYGIGSEVGERWAKTRRKELDEGRVEEVVAALRSHSATCEEIGRNVDVLLHQPRTHELPQVPGDGPNASPPASSKGAASTTSVPVSSRAAGAGPSPVLNAIIALRCVVESNRTTSGNVEPVRYRISLQGRERARLATAQAIGYDAY